MTAYRRLISFVAPTLVVAILSPLAACSDNAAKPVASGGQAGFSGTATSGSSTGGQSSAGAASGGMTTMGMAGTSASGSASGGRGGSGGAELAGGSGAGGSAGSGAGNGGASGSGGSGGGTAQGGVGGTHTGPTTNMGAYVRTGWTAIYTCTGTCPDTMPQDTQDKDTARAFDGNMGTRWSTGQFQQSTALMSVFPLAFTVDMKQINSISKMTFYAGGDPYDAPGEMDVLVSSDGATFTTALSAYQPSAPSKGGTETIMLPPGTACQFIKLKATKTIKQVSSQLADRYWAIGEMNVYP
jgi:hypothetical protein